MRRPVPDTPVPPTWSGGCGATFPPAGRAARTAPPSTAGPGPCRPGGGHPSGSRATTQSPLAARTATNASGGAASSLKPSASHRHVRPLLLGRQPPSSAARAAHLGFCWLESTGSGRFQTTERLRRWSSSRCTGTSGRRARGRRPSAERRAARVQGGHPHDDAGRAEAALRRAVGGEAVGPRLGVGQPGERRDLAPGHAGDGRDAGDPRLTVDPDRAAAALALRAAAVLGGARAEAIAQGLEEGGIVRLDLDVPAVEAEANQLS